MTKIYVGFDPGKTGALAAITEDGTCTTALPFPLSGDNELDITELTKWLKVLQEQGTVYAIIEKVHAMPGQGVTSMFSFGMTTGMLHGMLAALGIPRFLVSPQAWKKRILYDTAKDKNAAIEYCSRVYPYVSLLATPRSKKAHSGVADAVCIARHAYEMDKHG